MNRKVDWSRHIVHTIGAICCAGTIALIVMLLSEILWKDRGQLDATLLTREDFYGPIITISLAVCFLCVPFRRFVFIARTWISAISASVALFVCLNLFIDPVDMEEFNDKNFMLAAQSLGLISFLWIFSGRFKVESA